MTDIGGNAGLGVDGETALIVPARDETALAAAMQRLAENNELRKLLGPAGKEYIESHYHADKTAADLNRVYQKLLTERAT